MKYMLLIYIDEAKVPAEALTRPVGPAHAAYAEALQKAGALVAGDRLHPTSSASTVRVSDGRTEVLDGPYAEAKEQLGGYYVIDVADLDAALSWAARCPSASGGTIEVRPVWAM